MKCQVADIVCIVISSKTPVDALNAHDCLVLCLVVMKCIFCLLQALLNNPTSLTVTPDGVLYIADMGNLRVHSVVTQLPQPVHTHYR